MNITSVTFRISHSAFCILHSALLLSATAALAVPTVTIDSVTQRWPWNNKVDITYTVAGGTDMSAHEYYKIKFKATVNGTDYVLDGSKDVIASTLNGTHTVTWTNVPAVKATGCTRGATMYTTTGDYMIIDLNTGNMALEDMEAGDSLAAFPSHANARYNTGLYKTDWLVLRRVPRTAAAASNYSEGYPTGHANYSAPTYSGTYTNTATTWTTDKDFYAGLFMLTGSQYERVMGENYSYSFRAYGTNVRDWCPASAPAYNTLRNSKVATAPLSSSPASVSFFERLNAMTGVCGFDLPTEVMWEIATRAGDRRVYWWNDSVVFDDLCWRVVFSGERVTGPNNSKTLSFSVGLRNNGTMRTPNAWGLFDTMGNLEELCRDVGYYGDLKDAPDAFTPKYDPTATRAMGRGGYWEGGQTSARFHASYRSTALAEITSMAANYVGFRVFFVAP